MRSSTGGLWTTLLMFIPLVAVPALAIFGVPNSDALKASLDPNASSPPLDLDGPELGSPTAKKGARPAGGDLEGFFPAAETPFSRDGWEDPFLEVSSHLKNDGRRPRPTEPAPRGEPSEGTRTGSNAPVRLGEGSAREPKFDPFDHEPGVGKEPETLGAAPSAPDNPRKQFRTAEVPAEKPTAPAVASLSEAARRLKSLGITEYQLTGEGDGFLFTCQYRSPDNPRVMHRFEAEAASELDAIKDVLEQIEQFMARR